MNRNIRLTVGMILVICLLIFRTSSCSAQYNGFDLEGSLIPIKNILSGGPRKDGIPSIDSPSFVNASRATFLSSESAVLGMYFNGLAKAYPIKILNWHEIVNDQFNGVPVVITFCPLCGSGMAFSALIEDTVHTFGVSGLLYNSDVLIYDRQTHSLWSQLLTKAISGKHKGKQLVSLPVTHSTWQDWKTQYPETLVLSTQTGFNRDYSDNRYADYIQSPQLMFPVTVISRRYHPKEDVLGINIGDQFIAYPFVELEKSPEEFIDTVNGQFITIRFNRKFRRVMVFDQQGKQLAGVRTFWFAWYAFHPETEVYTVP